jgi:hypothetical protein
MCFLSSTRRDKLLRHREKSYRVFGNRIGMEHTKKKHFFPSQPCALRELLFAMKNSSFAFVFQRFSSCFSCRFSRWRTPPELRPLAEAMLFSTQYACPRLLGGGELGGKKVSFLSFFPLSRAFFSAREKETSRAKQRTRKL